MCPMLVLQVTALQIALSAVSLLLTGLVYWRAILDTVNTMPGLDISFTTVPTLGPGLVLELVWNLVTSYPGTSLAVC